MLAIKKLLQAPKGDGFSKRILGLFLVVLALVIGLFLHFTMGEIKAPGHNHSKAKEQVAAILYHDDAAQAIASITSAKHPRVLVQYQKAAEKRALTISESSLSDGAGQHASLEDAEISPFTAEDRKAAGNAALSVFSAPTAEANDYEEDGISHYRRENLAKVASTQQASLAREARQANDQGQKIAFMQQARFAKDYLETRLQKPLSSKELKAGTIIPATLVTGINSDLPGVMIAKIRRSVFDTASGNYLLIPQGTTLIGLYDSQVANGQSRVLVAWQRLIYPDGRSYYLEGMPGADLSGMAGLQDKVNNHYSRIFGSALLFSLFGSAAQLSQAQTKTNTMSAQQIIAASLGQQVTQTGMQLVAKNMNIQPTIEIRPGANFNVLITRDMLF